MMRPALLLLVFIGLFECFSAEEDPSIFIQVTWDMSWTRLCDLLPMFAKKLSGELIEFKELQLRKVSESRIRFINKETYCSGSRSTENAILYLFVSKDENDLSNLGVDKNLTILAYRTLYDYWRNHKMHLLDPVFLGEVTKVVLMGKDKPDIPEQMSESRKIGIAIVIALIIVFSIAILSCLVSARRKIRRTTWRPHHGVPIEEFPEPTIFRRGQENGHPQIYYSPRENYDQEDAQPRVHYSPREDYEHDDHPPPRENESCDGYPVQHHRQDDEDSFGSPML